MSVATRGFIQLAQHHSAVVVLIGLQRLLETVRNLAATQVFEGKGRTVTQVRHHLARLFGCEAALYQLLALGQSVLCLQAPRARIHAPRGCIVRLVAKLVLQPYARHSPFASA